MIVEFRQKEVPVERLVAVACAVLAVIAGSSHFGHLGSTGVPFVDSNIASIFWISSALTVFCFVAALNWWAAWFAGAVLFAALLIFNVPIPGLSGGAVSFGVEAVGLVISVIGAYVTKDD